MNEMKEEIKRRIDSVFSQAKQLEDISCELQVEIECKKDALFNKIISEIEKMCSLFIEDRQTRKAVLSRKYLGLWPFPEDDKTIKEIDKFTMKHMANDDIEKSKLCASIQEDMALFRGWWILAKKVAVEDLAIWAKPKLNRLKKGSGDFFEKAVKDESFPYIAFRSLQDYLASGEMEFIDDPSLPYYRLNIDPPLPVAGLVYIYKAEKAVKEELLRPAIAVDAGKHHHELLSGWRDVPKDTRKKHSFSIKDYQLQLIAPGKAIQLTLPLDEDVRLPELMIDLLKKWRGPMGLRHWAALQRLFSVEGGRSGEVRWTLREHMEALGYSASRKERREVQAQVAAEVELLTKFELAVLDKTGTIRERRPVIHVNAKYDRLEGSEWILDGMVFQINPWLYRGVRDEKSKELGSNWFPTSIELAQIDHERFHYAIALGMLLAIRWRWNWQENENLPGYDGSITIEGQKLLNLAGIKYKPKEPGRTWNTLENNLEELKRKNCLGRYEWTKGEPWTLKSLCRLWPADWQRDRTIHGLKPLELPPGPTVLTGGELKKWRKAHGLTQAEAAKKLGVSQKTVSAAELKASGAISSSLAAKVRSLGTS